MNEDLIKSNLVSLIFEFRGYRVMIDSDLSAIYGVTTKALKQQVKRNQNRFPPDFLFELNDEEKNQLVTNCDRLKNLKHSTVNPHAFTEHGVAMLSSVLRSEKAILVNIEIMRAFSKYRALLKENEDLKKEIHVLDQKINRVFKYLLDRIDALRKYPTYEHTRLKAKGKEKAI
ncbi:MAG: ORF6N domain-containing protein [Lentimicrobiaceae bacterium]|nr:ORF6N domain-containing protein [Lentimicrobiaceae bacterium]